MSIVRLIFLLLFALSLTGCAIKRPIRSMDPKPVLLHLPGVAGDNIFEREFVRSLRTGGLDADARIYEWTARKFMIVNLQSNERNRRAAKQLARHIAELRATHPHRPILLTSDSGGAGPMVWALEALPEDVQIDGAIMMGPALSPTYDLSKALKRVRGRMVAFTSPGDIAVLDWGTRLFGTIDGKKVAAAGRFGFRKPNGADDVQYVKLVQMPYRLEWLGRYANWGDHVGPLGPRFASGVIAPLLTELALGRSPDEPSTVVRLTPKYAYEQGAR